MEKLKRYLINDDIVKSEIFSNFLVEVGKYSGKILKIDEQYYIESNNDVDNFFTKM